MAREMISVIVVNWNGKQFLDDVFGSLLAQRYKNYELIMVDNGSVDGSIEYTKEKFPKVKVIELPKNIGFGPAVNKGARKARGKYILFLNNDLFLDKNCLGELLGVLRKKNIGAVVPKIMIFDKKDRINSYGGTVNYLGVVGPRYIYQKNKKGLKEEEVAFGGLLLLKKELFEKVGGFDRNIFLYHEDNDLCWRIRLLGKKIVVTPKAIIYHKYVFGRNPDKFYQSEKNRLLLVLKNYSLKTLILISPAALLLELAELFHGLTSGWLIKKIKSYFEILSLLPKIIKEHRKVQKRRKVSDKEITRIFSGKLVLHDIESPLIDFILNPALSIYWNLVKGII